MEHRAEIREYRNRRRIFIDGAPFLVLGIQFDFLNCTRVEDFDYLFEHAVTMGVNTVFFPVRWFVVEPEEGRYDWTVLDHALKRCKEKGLKMSVLWFGTNQGGSINPAPDWMKKDTKRFRRMMDEGKEVDGFCPVCEETLKTEKRSFDGMLKHLAVVDSADHTVILFQVENEICIRMNHRRSEGWPKPLLDHWPERCRCAVCEEKFEKSERGGWEFGVRSLTDYLNGLLKDQKKLFPALSYVNFPINPLRGGEDIGFYLSECPNLDVVGADYYGFSPGDLAFAMNYFSQGRNIPFIAEHSTESLGDADMNLYLSICQHGVQCFSPWAIDHAFGWRAWRDHVEEKPFVSKDGTWSDAAILYGRAQSSLNRISLKVAETAGTEDFMWYVSHRIPRNVEERRWGVRWRMTSGRNSQWACCRTSDNEFTIAGVETTVTIRPLSTKKKLDVEQGYWTRKGWVRENKMEPAVSRAEADKTEAAAFVFELDNGKAYKIIISQ